MANRKTFRSPLLLGIALACFPLAVGTAHGAEPTHEDAQRLFTLKVLPVLQAKCFGCHGSDSKDIRGDYNLLTREGMLTGGESGEPSLVPGHPEESTLYQAVLWNGYEMPPKENDRLSASQIDDLRQWIAAGAPWPSPERQAEIRDAEWANEINEDGQLVKTSGGTSDEWTNRRYDPHDLWAFQKLPEKKELLVETLPLHRAIDRLVSEKLAEANVPVAPQASPRQLIMRANWDLLGLPATPQQIDAFEAAWALDADKAWRDLIDRLLNDPRYGERWGRHWLDVTRYADTGGMANDYERSNMWRYRDYVIRAFNSDKPYDEFIVEQLAGDELADQSVRARSGGKQQAVDQAQTKGDYHEDEAEAIIATGFLRMGPWDNAMVEMDEARQIYLDDLVNITGQTFLGQTMRCCKCHDHKFDPLPTRDYYRMYSAFSTTHMAERSVPFLPEENQERFDEQKQHVQRMLKFAVDEKKKLVDKREAAARQWFEEHNLPYKDEAQRRDLPDDEKPPRHCGLDHVEQGQLKVREQDEWIWTRRLERFQPMAQSVYNAPASQINAYARKLRIKRAKAPKNDAIQHILIGGALTALGDAVQPGVLSAVGIPTSPASETPYVITSDTDGRRLELARWIAHPENGLTSRAIVNRIWQFHFGQAIAANPNNLGAKGGKPSHPELLDYLAVDFVENGRTIKRLHREIMLSEAYRRASIPAAPEQVAEVDPNNQLLSYFPRRRLSAEEIRDGILSISGELVHCDGGLPVMPEINMEVALQPRMIQFSLAPAYQPSATPEQRNRRTIYAYHVRGQADPFTELFNQPNPNDSCELREAAAVTPQVFTLLNSDTMIDRSIALALRLEQSSTKVSDQIDQAFRLVLGRHASPEERERLSRYVADMQTYHAATQPLPVSYPTEITRSLVEEFSGDVFEYTEVLPVFENYQQDTKPADVSPETRALADLCLLLLNSNEFMYVD
ncbi:PSD1 and planctomycete cytochrome C domain-containing protein [Bremerella sp. JC770]|uniref:PSD1 and planctomycete cytochrome C domain-containing protein n=1 Tax=Bremerella sp. JC770 TaxID=3232137 RepID=UPI003458FD6C